jgi:SET domain-containing protein
MKDIFTDRRLFVSESKFPGAELGMFSESFIPSGTIVEIARTLKLKNEHLFQPGNILNDYVFKLDDKHSIIAFGCGSMYNHSDDPHLTYKVTDGKIYYKSIKDIFPGDEVTISYGTDWWKNRGIKPVEK